MRYLVNISYDGTKFYGSAPQPNRRTVTGVLEEILSKILNEKTKITACSRTDKGVHANNFFFHFDTDKTLDIVKVKASLNKLVPSDIYVKSVVNVSGEFHARFSVINKEYKYIINTGKYCPTKRNIELEYGKTLDIELLKKASTYLLGTHDFESFTSNHEKENYVRTINYIKILEKDDVVEILINGDGFLKYMIRNIIGLFLEINEGKKNIEDIEKILESKDRTKLGITAPPEGLYLNFINYDFNKF